MLPICDFAVLDFRRTKNNTRDRAKGHGRSHLVLLSWAREGAVDEIVERVVKKRYNIIKTMQGW